MELPQPYSSPPPATAAPPTSSTVLHPTIPASITTVNALFMACHAQSACSMQTSDDQIRQCHIGTDASNHHDQLYCIRPVNADRVRKKTRLDPSMQAEDHVRVSTVIPLAQHTFNDNCHENRVIKYDQINEEEECCTTPTRAQCTCNRNDQEWVVDADLAGLLAVQKIDVSTADHNNNEEREKEGFLDIKKRSWMEAKQKTSMYRSRCRCNETSEPPPAPRKPKAKPRMIKSCSHPNFFDISPANLELFFHYMTSTAAPEPDEHATTNENDIKADDV